MKDKINGGIMMWKKSQVVEKMQVHGKKLTDQREILINIILEDKWHSNKEIYYEAVKRNVQISIATVYRTMDLLEEIGILRRCYQYHLT